MALVMAPEAGLPPSHSNLALFSVLSCHPLFSLLFSSLRWPGSHSLVAHTPAPHDMVFTSVDLIKTSPVTQALVGGGSGPGGVVSGCYRSLTKPCWARWGWGTHLQPPGCPGSGEQHPSWALCDLGSVWWVGGSPGR